MTQTPAWAAALVDPEHVDGEILETTSFGDETRTAVCVHADGSSHDLEADTDGMFTSCETDDRALVPATLWQASGRAAALFRDADAVLDLSRRIKAGLVDHVHKIAAAAKAERREGEPTKSTLAPELSVLADAHDTLSAISKAIAEGASEAKGLAGEVALELAPDKALGSTSVRVGTGSGGLKVTRTQGTKARVDDEDVVDVLTAYLLGHAGVTDTDDPHGAYARGIREGIARFRDLVGPPAWKTTALDELVRTLEAADEHDLAIRLGHAFGRISSGNPTVKIERIEPKS